MTRRRGIQKQTADVLRGLGFSPVSATTFTRQVGQQLHFIGLQYGGSSRGFTFNLGCHFAGVPTVGTFRLPTLDDLDDLECGLRVRVGRYIRDGLDLWWDADNAELPASLAEASWAVQRAFDDCLRSWGNGSDLLRSHVKVRAGSIRLSQHLLRWFVNKHCFSSYAFLAMLAHHRGARDLACMLHQRALTFPCFPDAQPRLCAFLGQPSSNRDRRRTRSS